jgi:hypothetical protein
MRAHIQVVVPELELLVAAGVQLPEAVLAEYQRQTGWAVRVTSWEGEDGSVSKGGLG